MAHRAVDGPGKDWLTEAELAAYLGVSPSLLKTLLRKGAIPQPRKLNRQTKAWSWRTAFWISEGIDLGMISADALPEDSDIEDEN